MQFVGFWASLRFICRMRLLLPTQPIGFLWLARRVLCSYWIRVTNGVRLLAGTQVPTKRFLVCLQKKIIFCWLIFTSTKTFFSVHCSILFHRHHTYMLAGSLEVIDFFSSPLLLFALSCASCGVDCGISSSSSNEMSKKVLQEINKKSYKTHEDE